VDLNPFIFRATALLSVGLCGGGTLASAQGRIGTGEVREQYQLHCAACHGAEMDAGVGGSLLDRSNWKQVGRTITFLDYVKEGNEEAGMPAFGEALSDAEIRAIEILIEEMTQMREREGRPVVEVDEEGVFASGPYRYRLETVVEGLETPWSVDFDDRGDAWITEKRGQLRQVKEGVLQAPVEGLPDIWVHGQGGLLEVALHPEFRDNGWIYLSFSEQGGVSDNGRPIGFTKVVRGRVVDNRWTDEETLFEVPIEFHSGSGAHFGSRFVFQDGYLFFSVGDRGAMHQAQDLTRPNGKIHRIHDDGRIPEDNPFVEQPGAFPTIWSYGNRNAQGLDLHPVTGELWESEHGPRGGDEINRIEKGVNYGWPVITHGMNYNGKPITGKTAAPGMAQPALQWTPSIAVCGIDFYEGDNLVFPEWENDLFVGGLRSEQLHRLEIESGEIVGDTIVLTGVGRIRDVASGPDGHLYLVLNGPDSLVRLVPAD